MATTKNIKQVVDRIQGIVDNLLEPNHMVRGSFTTAYRRCGRPTCWCASSEKGHPTTRITWTENGISHTKTIKVEDQKRFRKATQTYRNFRHNRRRLRAEEKLLEGLLDIFEKEIEKSAEEQ